MSTENDRFQRQLTTADDVPLEDLFDYGVTLIDMYNEADRPFQTWLGREVDTKTFKVRTGDMTWEKAAEGEHARTGTLDSESMAFGIDKHQRSLGYSREFIEDNPADILRDELDALVKGAGEAMFETTFEVVQNGIADGTPLWTSPPSPGTNDFGNDHDHTFETTAELFDDSDPHTAGEHIAKGNTELQHHKYRPDVAFVSPDLAYKLVAERTDQMDYWIPEAEGLRTTAIPEVDYNVGGTRVIQTAELSGNEMYIFDSSEKPLYYHTVRPVELTQGEDGPPVGDPAQLVGSWGSTRFGVKMVNPFAGVKIVADNIA